MATESTPLSENMKQLQDAYGLECHAKFVKIEGEPEEILVDYEPLKISSFRVCCAGHGTILKDPILFVEQLVLTLIFCGAAVPVYFYFREELETGKEDVSVRRWLSEQEGGVGGIKAATVDLEWLLFQNVTQDEQVLSAVRRYGRTSLMLIFLWRRHELDNLKQHLVSRELLTAHEADQLLKWNHCLHETIWAWQTQIITMLYKEGKIKSDQLFNLLLERCLEGRAAVQLVHTHLAVRVPMQYVHLLGLLVKMHNLVLAFIMGCLFGAAFRSREMIICVQLFARTLILPFLFNAILLINAELSDPFDGSVTDFPGEIYQQALDKDCKGFVAASQSMPDWVNDRQAKA